MEYEILVTKHPNNGYFARPILMPEIVVEGKNEAEALSRVREAISAAFSQSHITRIDVPLPGDAEADPWLRFSGEWGDESRKTQFQADIEAFRKEIDLQNLGA